MVRSGRIKAGEGTLIGNAGEHYVMAELLRRGVVAGLCPRNARGFDVLASNQGRSVRIRVKTKEAAKIWRWVVKKTGEIFPDLGGNDDFTVLVDLEKAQPEFFILPTATVNAWLEKDFAEWFSRPGKNGRPHDPKNPMRALSRDKFESQLEQFRSWEGLWAATPVVSSS